MSNTDSEDYWVGHTDGRANAEDEIETLTERIKELAAERDEWKGKFEWAAQRLRDAANGVDTEWIEDEEQNE